MSHVTELAEAEANAVEDELGPDDPDELEAAEDDEPTPEPEPAEDPSSLAVVEELTKKTLAEAKRHENAFAKLHPEDWDTYTMCPLCIGDGFLIPIPPGQMPDQVWEAVTVLAGRLQDGQVPVASYSEVCDECQGWGQVRTGALNTTNALVQCKRCKGYGWFDIEPASTPGMIVPNIKPQPATPPPPPGGPMNQPIDGTVHTPPPGWQAGPNVNGNDNWGRWQGHPRYGIDTQFTGGVW